MLVKAIRRGQHADGRIIEPGETFECATQDLALVEDHGDQANGGAGWMELVDPAELLSFLPADERALWHRRRTAAATMASATATLEVSRREYAANQMSATTSTAQRQAATAQTAQAILDSLDQTIALAGAAMTKAQAEITSAEMSLTQAQAEHAAAHEGLRRLREARTPPSMAHGLWELGRASDTAHALMHSRPGLFNL